MKFLPFEGFPFQAQIYSQEEYIRLCKKRKSDIPISDTPGYCIPFDDAMIVCIKDFTEATTEFQNIQLCFHEAVHVVQYFFKCINEKVIGEEHQAYLIGWVGIEIYRYMKDKNGSTQSNK